ncbi:hypothetical protein JYK14_04170 [Siccirubricoccus sp. KC 17139]|uniref:AlgX/AlgJ SGNH hydrolase-like domain-containing protein n=1 Tax=Siccirubricoccus soli TaxID=2899147 RepID=A0ABT1D0E5_9PROT|nr:hypothetical protein [Siccirubricoccus soli]MCO6415372.1 hypothetical protein [Siccirubricoccus soli]MCP2681504.1 hypothetical protein [Siccirubricoccus soli]
MQSDPSPPPSLIGMVDVLTPPGTLHGWARLQGGEAKVTIIARRGGAEIARALAELARPDLTQHQLGDCAFRLDAAAPLTAAELASGEVVVTAEAPGLAPVTLPLSPSLRPPEAARPGAAAVVAALEALDAHALAELRLTAKPGGMAARMLEVMTTAFASGWAQRALLDDSRPEEDRVAWLPLPVGLVSGDGAAMLGRGGWLFLTGGPNRVLDLYPPMASPASVAEDVAKWAALCRARRTACAQRGIGFRQLIIPEKLSLLAERLPLAVETPSCLLAGLEAALGGLEGDYLSGLAVLRQAPPEAMFRRLDSHFTPEGAWRLAAAVAASLGLPPLELAPEFAPRGRLGGGDLTLRFFGVPMAEPLAEAEAVRLARPEVILDAPAPGGAHLGTRRAWRNPAAKGRGRLLVCGNSFAAPDGQEGLCWWLAQYVEEVHFLWSPALDWEEVARVRPDWVLCQTVERYLPAVPGA